MPSDRDSTTAERPPTSSVPALRPGDHVRLIAPSSPLPAGDFEVGVARLRERYRVSYDPGVMDRRGYLAGSDARRLAELRDALADSDVSAILPGRGGYGATRLLDDLSVDEVRRANKLLVGFSDITALHALFTRAGLRSIHGPMVAALGRAEPSVVNAYFRMLEGGRPGPMTGLETIAGGVAEGPLLGGNLAVLAALCGTPHAPDLQGSVLLLEDAGEAPYRVDRLLTTLRQAGWFRGLRAVVLGQFTACGPGPDGRTVDDVLREAFSILGIPILAGLPVGHGDPNVPVPLGARVQVDADRGVLTYLEHAVHVR